MQVILLEKVVNVGDLGEVVKVRQGYARNFLIPQGKAKRATPENLKLLEEHIRHIGVVVLSGMNQGLLDLWILSECAQHRRDFHEIWTRADYVKNMHAGPLPPSALIAQA